MGQQVAEEDKHDREVGIEVDDHIEDDHEQSDYRPKQEEMQDYGGQVDYNDNKIFNIVQVK